MVWAILAAVAILILAYAFRKATKGTPFRNCMGCTPNIDRLRGLEDKSNKETSNED